MSPATHAAIGLSVIVANLAVGIWAIAASRRSPKPSGALRVAVLIAFALLVLQVLVGVDLWIGGGRPAPSSLLSSYVHVLGPVLALLGAVYHIFVSSRNPVRNYAVATLLTVALGLISYAIGEMGPRLM